MGMLASILPLHSSDRALAVKEHYKASVDGDVSSANSDIVKGKDDKKQGNELNTYTWTMCTDVRWNTYTHAQGCMINCYAEIREAYTWLYDHNSCCRRAWVTSAVAFGAHS